MWQAIKRRGTDWRSVFTADRVRDRDSTFVFKVPNPYGGPAWITATLALSSRARGIGETLRIRGHIDSCLRIPDTAADRAALAHQRSDSDHSMIHYGRRVAASLARRAVERLPGVAIDHLSRRRRRRWLDVQISTAPLDAGARALMPEPLRAVYGDRLPQAGPNGPRVGVWSGPAGGPRGGMARLAMVQIDPSDLGARDATTAGKQHFSLNLSLAELVEPAGADDAESS